MQRMELPGSSVEVFLDPEPLAACPPKNSISTTQGYTGIMALAFERWIQSSFNCIKMNTFKHSKFQKVLTPGWYKFTPVAAEAEQSKIIIASASAVDTSETCPWLISLLKCNVPAEVSDHEKTLESDPDPLGPQLNDYSSLRRVTWILIRQRRCAASQRGKRCSGGQSTRVKTELYIFIQSVWRGWKYKLLRPLIVIKDSNDSL